MHGASARSRRLVATLALNVALVVLQAAAGVLGHSMGLIADAGHNLTDVAGVAVSLLVVRWAGRPRSAERSFGNYRGTVLAALANAVALAAVTGVVAVESIRRLLHPVPVTAGLVVAVAGFAFLLNAAAALLLHGHRRDLNIRSTLAHMAGDALGSLAVAVAGTVMLVSHGGWWLDPAAALVVAAIIVTEAVAILRETAVVLLESTPPDLDLASLEAAIVATEGVVEVHDLHAWSLSSEVRALSAHLVLAGHPTLEEAQTVSEQVKVAIAAPFAISHTTLELECERCSDAEEDPCRMDTLPPHTPAPPTDASR